MWCFVSACVLGNTSFNFAKNSQTSFAEKLSVACLSAEMLKFSTVALRLHPTEKVFAKGGLNLTASSISTERSKLLFQIVKLQKKYNMKSKLRLNVSGFSTIYSTPPFANTMLVAVLFWFFFNQVKIEICVDYKATIVLKHILSIYLSPELNYLIKITSFNTQYFIESITK